MDSSSKQNERGPNALYLISPETLETRQLTTPTGGDFGDSAPSFSPDGKIVAFVRTTADSRDEIYTVPIEGGTPKKIVTDGLWTNGLAWDATGASIVFDRSFAGGFSLWRVRSTGGEMHRLDLPSKGANLLEPALWRDRLAYETHETVETAGRVPLDDSLSEIPQVPLASTRVERAAQYSPHGDRIAFLSNRTGTDELWISDADGANPFRLTNIGAPQSGVSWAPDGRSVALSTCAGKVYLVSVEAGSPRLIFAGLPFTDENATNIRFSGDGKYLYVLSEPGTGNKYELLKIQISDGTPIKVLDGIVTNFEEAPDGRTLFYSRPKFTVANGAPGIWRRDLNGGPEEYVMEFSNLWDLGVDGIYVLNATNSAIEKYTFSGKRVKTLAKLGKFDVKEPLSVSPDGRWALFGHRIQQSVEIDMVEGFE